MSKKTARRPIPLKTRIELFKITKQCYYCCILTTRHNRQIDHLVAVALGGTNDISNLVVSCKTCNRKKGKKSHDDYIVSRIKQIERELQTLQSRLKNTS